MNPTLAFVLQTAGLIGIVVLVQVFGCTTFDSDEWERIIISVVGIGLIQGGVAAAARRKRNRRGDEDS